MFRFLCAMIFVCVLSVSAPAADLFIFGADWCPACRQLKAALDANPDLVAGFDSVQHVDVSANKPLARKYNVSFLPTLIVLDGETVVKRKVGFNGVADLKRWLSSEEQPGKTRRRLLFGRNRE